jgi:hypothetical protein
MSSRSLRRSVAILAFAALLAPVASLQAAQSRHQPAPARAVIQSHSPLVNLVLRLLAGFGIRPDTSVAIDGNG